MRTKSGLMSAMILSFAFGAWSPALAQEGAVTTEVPVASQEKASERISLKSLKNMRDPFKRMTSDTFDLQDDKPRSELETVPVSEFKMVGVLTGPYKTRALVRAPSGAVYPVSDGTRLGVQNGYVKKVLQDRIIISEVVQDVLGEKEQVISELKLNAKGAEKGVSSVRAISAPSEASKEKEESAHESADAVSSLRQDGIKQVSSAGPAAQPASAEAVASPFNLSVPAPVTLPKPGLINGAASNSPQQTAGAR